MVPYQADKENWRDGYTRIIDQINALGPEMVTVGALRASNLGALRAAAAKNRRPIDIFGFLTEKDPSGFKHRLPVDTQVEMLRFALDRLDRRRIVPALCKEDLSIWRAVRLGFRGCHCLPLDTQVPEELVSTRSFEATLKD
jgi:hypothetical protein